MKRKLLSALRAVSPGLADRAVRLRQRMSSTPLPSGDPSQIAELEATVEALRAEVRELREEIDESRRDALRIAELTDIVEQRLAQ